MREIAFDTETTGFKPSEGHRVVEIGCVEMVNRLPTGRTFHSYLNPERDMPAPAFSVHGLSEQFLSDKPKFIEIADSFLEFVGESKLIIHNAEFDMNFINAELFNVKKPAIPNEQSFCTLIHARKKFPGMPASLDALCKRFSIDISARDKHGALLDAELLAKVYLELMGGSQVKMELSSVGAGVVDREVGSAAIKKLSPRAHAASESELSAHAEFLKKIKGSIWQ